jgi:transposase-like protein
MNFQHNIEALAAELGLLVMSKMMEEEVRSKIGAWGSQSLYRHGKQKGYVVFAGRKLALEHPRVRSRENKEVPLESYQAFQSDGAMQEAVARQMMRQCSTRNYEGAIEQLTKGYGMKRSSVSRHFKAATAQELKGLLERPVPADLLVLMIDGQYFARQCITVALGIDKKGCKHVLGLWHGATENSTVVGALLEDLEARGLKPTHPILVVIDGSKALRKAVQMVLGDRAVVQRCRVHKQRNVVEHLPREKQRQAIWRLRAAWDKKNPKEAEKELRKIAQWLESFSPMAARSLKEGLEETLTLQTLGINSKLGRTLSSTNVIESCFARVEHWTHRVKHWHDPDMVLRWSASALLLAEKGFRRLRGHEQFSALEEALTDLQPSPILKAA